MEHRRRYVKATIYFAEGREVERVRVTVDDGFMEDGKFVSGAIREVEVEPAELERMIGFAIADSAERRKVIEKRATRQDDGLKEIRKIVDGLLRAE